MGHSCITITPPEGDRILAVGGIGADGKSVMEAELFNPVTEEWIIDDNHTVPHKTNAYFNRFHNCSGFIA